jgi:hypothetical protein
MTPHLVLLRRVVDEMIQVQGHILVEVKISVL